MKLSVRSPVVVKRSGWTERRRWLWLWLWLWGAPAWAGDPLTELVLDRPYQFRYQETRRLALLTEPWHGSGFLLADPDGTLVKLQLLPERLVLVATPDALLYYRPADGERRRLPLPSSLPQVQGIVLLQRLLRGDLEAVRRDFLLETDETKAGWRLVLTPKGTEAPFRRVILGTENGARYLEIQEANGDRSRTTLILDEYGDHLKVRIARLYRQAQGE